MKCCFIHDTKFKKTDNGKLYTGGSFSEEVWKQYTDIFESFIVLARCEYINCEDVEKKYNIFDEKIKKFRELKNFNSIKNIKLSKRILEDEIKKTDFIIIRLPSFNGNLAVKIAQKYHKPYVIEVVGCAWDALWYHSLKGKILAPIMYFVTKKNIKNAKSVIYITKEFLQQRYPTSGKKYICSNVMLKDIEQEKEFFRKIKNNQICIGTIGAIDVDYKGQKYVIKAISYLKRKNYNYNIKYYLVGKGNSQKLFNICKKLNVVDNVKFVGTMPHNKIFDFLKGIDIYIQPSTAEAQGRSLIEAMSNGCACICSNVGGMPELLDKQSIFKKKNYKDIAEKIKFTIENLEKISKDSFYKSKEYNSLDIVNKRKKIFNEIIKEKRYE